MSDPQTPHIKKIAELSTGFSFFDGVDKAELKNIDQEATIAKYESEVSNLLSVWGEDNIEYTYLTADQTILAETGNFDKVTRWMDDEETIAGLNKEMIKIACQTVYNNGSFWVLK